MTDAVSESVPRGNRPANVAADRLREALLRLEERLNERGEYGAKERIAWLDAALRAERLTGRQEALNDARNVIRQAVATSPSVDRITLKALYALLDEVGVAGLTEERT